MSAALARHEALVTEVVASHGGRLIKSRGEGDSTLSVFVRADAVAAALALQQVLAGELWPEGIALPTRAALHSGEAELRDGDYYQTLNRGGPATGAGRGWSYPAFPGDGRIGERPAASGDEPGRCWETQPEGPVST
jgi:hypothetical protein